jgi:hypothetical protein
MNRRSFLRGLTAAAAVTACAPKLLAAKSSIPVPGINAYQAYGVTSRAGDLWSALYELDPRMDVSVDYKLYAIFLRTRAPVGMVTDVLWTWKPIGVIAYINGHPVDFARHYEKWYGVKL